MEKKRPEVVRDLALRTVLVLVMFMGFLVSKEPLQAGALGGLSVGGALMGLWGYLRSS